MLGAGTMGHGIAEVFSLYGNQVFIYDSFPQALQKGLERIKWSLDKLKEKGSLKEEVQDVMKRIYPINELRELNVDLVIEAVPENFEIKTSVYEEIQKKGIVKDNTIVATNTSSLPVTELSRVFKNPENFLGLHFFNPPVLMKLVEVIKGERTSQETFDKGISIVKSIEKVPIPVRKDVVGFVVNRILFRVFTSACKLLSSYTVEEIDSLAKYVLDFPMGVFELLDYTGIDTNYLISQEVKKRGFNFECQKVEELYKRGEYGTKTGKGFYDWSRGRPNIPRKDRMPAPSDLLADAIAEAHWLVDNGVSTTEEVNLATKLDLGWKKGIFDYEKEIQGMR